MMPEESVVQDDVIKVPTLADIYFTLLRHVDREKDMQKKVDELYKKTVVGNGEPSLVDQVRTHARWIGGVNKIVWLLVSLLLGQLVVGGCSIVSVLYLVAQSYLAAQVP